MKEYIARRIAAIHVTDADGVEVPADLIDSLGVSLISNEAVAAPTLGPAIADRTYVVGGAPVTIDLSQRFIGAISYGMTPANIPGVTRSGATVTIDPVQTRAATEITVSGTNAGGTVSMTFTLTINAVSPTLTAPLPDQSLTVGDANVILALGSYFADAASYTVSPTGQGVTLSGANLTISAAVERNASYTVTASNGTGQTVSDSFSLVVATGATVPAAFATEQWSVSTGLEPFQIVVNVTSLPDDGGSEITSLQYEAGAGWTNLVGTATGSRILTMPAEGTEYSVRIRARNAVGTGLVSTAKSVTSGAEPSAQIQTLMAEDGFTLIQEL